MKLDVSLEVTSVVHSSRGKPRRLPTKMLVSESPVARSFVPATASDLASRLNHHEATIANHEVSLLVHEGGMTRHGATIAIHEVLLAELQQQQQSQSQPRAKAALNGAVSKLRQHRDMQNRQITELHGANATWVRQVTELGGALTELKKQISELSDDTVPLKKRVEQIENRYRTLQRNAQNVQREIQLVVDANTKLTTALVGISR